MKIIAQEANSFHPKVLKEIHITEKPITPCKHLDTDESCLIIQQLCGEAYYPPREECVACSRCHEPQTVNEITSVIANKILIELDRPTLYKIGHGPGTRLKKTISWFISVGSCGGCEDRAKIMDSWGVEGCKNNTATIVHWLYDSAHISGITTTRMAIEMIVKVLLATPYKTQEKIEDGTPKH